MEHMPYHRHPDATGPAAVTEHFHGSGRHAKGTAEGSASVTDEPDEQVARTPLPRPISLLFASVFAVAMLYSIATDGDPKVIIALGAFSAVTLGVDLGSLIGRK